ncbi:carbamoyltransferase [Cohnella zeiphila]|uniref:Carbamoyl transferase n=1 Tax=Cohnella zeiphila TaxID=2761120 RepID=A0A7X0VU77_9BACL|nr:carbamoyltransferase C-terminal domain-containing protein [Cohnella zeiphila]MBB6729982.1 hypothetical protein [Cohnella zeiphila]
MNVLGLGGSMHDFSACLVSDGTIRFAVEDERLSRIKHSDGLDAAALASGLAARYCLDAAGLSAEDVDLFVGNDILDPRYGRSLARAGIPVRAINHHLAHAASAFYPSDFEEAAILVVDGSGSLIDPEQGLNETVTFYCGENANIRELRKDAGKAVQVSPYPKVQDSVGGLYTTVTEALGFKRFDEGKTMGLAAYGTDRYVRDFYDFYELTEDGRFRCDERHARRRTLFELRLLRPSRGADELFQIKADIAYALQFHLERILVAFCDYLHRATGSRNLCLAGGVALNSVANRIVLERTPFERLFVQPAASDNGTAIGSALYGWHSLLGQPRDAASLPSFNPYLGREYDDADVEQALAPFRDRLDIVRPDDICKETARLLSEGRIVGWFQGRSEIGPRSLGNRSILADPRRAGMKDVINARIKHREPFRPFAPIVPEEDQEQYFELSHPSYYMLLVPKVREDKHSVIPAVTHRDGTGRVQTVSAALNPKLHKLTNDFRKLTGVPVLLNTSFNDNGEPIVESPADAVACFLKIDLDHLVLHDFLLSKKQGSAGR